MTQCRRTVVERVGDDEIFRNSSAVLLRSYWRSDLCASADEFTLTGRQEFLH